LRRLDASWGIRDHFDQGHVRWLYTFVKAPGFPFIEVDGQTYHSAQRDRALTVPSVSTPAPAALIVPPAHAVDIVQRLNAVAEQLGATANALAETARMISSIQATRPLPSR
jgi:hypothetical protein